MQKVVQALVAFIVSFSDQITAFVNSDAAIFPLLCMNGMRTHEHATLRTIGSLARIRLAHRVTNSTSRGATIPTNTHQDERFSGSRPTRAQNASRLVDGYAWQKNRRIEVRPLRPPDPIIRHEAPSLPAHRMSFHTSTIGLDPDESSIRQVVPAEGNKDDRNTDTMSTLDVIGLVRAVIDKRVTSTTSGCSC